MSTPLDPLLRPDHCVALMLGEALADDVETYDVHELTGVASVPELSPNRTNLFIEIDGRRFQAIVFEREAGDS